ncbi:MAG: HAMP domain-containing histidine kinase [Bacilli bacterium]|nr:HAMP domain-containing histidine kinase [Bacilli bacterium]
MRFFDGFLLNTILLLFPLFIYLVYVSYQKNINKDYMNYCFDIALVLSLFLISKFSYFKDDIYISILINIPLLFAYLKGRKFISLLISFILIVYSVLIFEYNPYLIVSEYCTYFILYIVTKRKNITSLYIINSFTIIKAFILSFFSFGFIYPEASIWLNLFRVIISISTFYIASIFYYKLVQKIEDMMMLSNTIKELEKEKMIRNSLFKITHEIKNPIAVCKGYLDMVDLSNNKKIDKYIPIIKSEINRTLSLLDDYLDFSKVKIEKDIIDIIMLVEDTTRSMGVLLKDKNVLTEFDISDEEVYMMADYNRLKQVLVNIIKNSMESKLEYRQLIIKLKTEISKNNIKIIINDNGIGMSKEELERLGEAFYTTKPNGTGIGVNLSKEIIERHNGTLTYSSEKYEGTTVTISFPLDYELNME